MFLYDTGFEIKKPKGAKQYRRCNAYVIECNSGAEIFVSYETPICVLLGNGNVLVSDNKYSRTTGKQKNWWLGDKADVIIKTIEVEQKEINKIVNIELKNN